MNELGELERKLAELRRANHRLRADLAVPPAPDEAVADRGPSSKARIRPASGNSSHDEEADAAEVCERLARLHVASGDPRRPPVPADSRGLLRAAEDLADGEVVVTVQCRSTAVDISATLASLLSETTRMISVRLEIVPGTARENADYARRVAAAHPAISVESAAEAQASDLTRARAPAAFLTAGNVVGRGWLNLLVADLEEAGTDAVVARSPDDPDRHRWLSPGEPPSWLTANDLAPLAAASPRSRGDGPLPEAGCRLVRAGVEDPASWATSRALVWRTPERPSAPSVVDASAFGARLANALGFRLRLAFVILGIPPGGAGGTHSIVQETIGLRRLGVDATILLPADRLEHARSVYPAAEPAVFTPFSDSTDLSWRLQAMHVTAATEFRSVRLADDAPVAALRAYYLQDYEPLFASPASPAADEALLSLDASSRRLLFAKTRWLCELVESVHGVAVSKVEPSLDRDLFHPTEPVSAGGGPLRITAMIRPRTVRRRAAATVRVLERLLDELGDQIHVSTFGCSDEELEQLLGRPARFDHHGVLRRDGVADLLQRSQLFLDLSAYQAFGRSGIEAMACGCVPVLPSLGGAREYAVNGRNALLLDVRSDDAVVEAVERLLDDRDVLEALRREGLRTAERFSIERAALSIYALFAQALIADQA